MTARCDMIDILYFENFNCYSIACSDCDLCDRVELENNIKDSTIYSEGE